ncbi:MAG: hypothetical protein ACKOQT_08285 [Acidimicrobiaceae bacterium]
MSASDFFQRRLETDDKWMNDAACRGLSDIFFPPAAERPQARERREQMARAVCETCARYFQLVATLLAIIMNMGSGAANLKNSDIKRASI